MFIAYDISGLTFSYNEAMILHKRWVKITPPEKVTPISINLNKGLGIGRTDQLGHAYSNNILTMLFNSNFFLQCTNSLVFTGLTNIMPFMGIRASCLSM